MTKRKEDMTLEELRAERQRVKDLIHSKKDYFTQRQNIKYLAKLDNEIERRASNG